MCTYCESGKINQFGEEWYSELPFKLKGNVSHNRPQIFKTNGKYFLIIENFYAIEIKACPMCGTNFETPVLSKDDEKIIAAGDMVAISDGPDADTYKDSVFEVLTEPYEIGGETVVKIKDHKSGKYFGGGYTTKYLRKVKKNDNPSVSHADSSPYTEEPLGDSSATPQNDKMSAHQNDKASTHQNDTKPIQSDGEPMENSEGATENV